MQMKERLFICKKGHQTKKLAWQDVYVIDCSQCKLKAHRALVGRGRNAQNSQPFVYYERPSDGEIFVAATAEDTRHPRGFVRKEIRTMNEYSQFRRQYSERMKADAEINREQEKAFRSMENKAGRERLESMLSSLSPEARAFAEAAIESSYNVDVPAVSPECMIQGFELDRSERQPYQDEHHGYRRMD